MPLGKKLGLSPGDSVLDGDSAPSPQRGWSPLPNFRPISIVAKTAGCIKILLGMEVGLSSGDFVLDQEPALSSQEGGGDLGRSPRNFRLMSIVAKRLDGSRWHLAWR